MIDLSIEEVEQICRRAIQLGNESRPDVWKEWEEFPKEARTQAMGGVATAIQAMLLLGYKIEKP